MSLTVPAINVTVAEAERALLGLGEQHTKGQLAEERDPFQRA